MKTAISLPDDLFSAADSLARKLGITRSRLFASALAEYIAKHRTAKVTERLNLVYASEPSQADKATRRGQRRIVARSEW